MLQFPESAAGAISRNDLTTDDIGVARIAAGRRLRKLEHTQQGSAPLADQGNSSVATALTVLEALSLSDGVGVSQLARQLDLPKSTVQRTLLTLKAAGWARQDRHARWGLTLRCAVVSQRVISRTTLSEAVRPIVVELRDETRETVRCFLIEAMNIVLLDVAESDQAVRAVDENLPNSVPLHATAIGKAALAARPDELAAVLARPLRGVTPKTITDPDVLRRDIDEVRRQGWAEMREEMHLDVGGVAAVTALASDIMIGMGITYPLHRASKAKTAAYGRLAQASAAHAAQVIGPRLRDIR
jgi:DNA-binding IclR family transcriptional regulator